MSVTLQVSPKTVYHNLRWLNEADTVRSADYREMAQAVLADPTIRLTLRQAVANRLNEADRLMEVQIIKGDDSY